MSHNISSPLFAHPHSTITITTTTKQDKKKLLLMFLIAIKNHHIWGICNKWLAICDSLSSNTPFFYKITSWKFLINYQRNTNKRKSCINNTVVHQCYVLMWNNVKYVHNGIKHKKRTQGNWRQKKTKINICRLRNISKHTQKIRKPPRFPSHFFTPVLPIFYLIIFHLFKTVEIRKKAWKKKKNLCICLFVEQHTHQISISLILIYYVIANIW